MMNFDVPDTVSRATGNSSDEHILAARADGDAIVSGSNDGVSYVNVGSVAYVHAVSVGAVSGCGDRQVPNGDVVTVRYLSVEPHAVHEIQVVYRAVSHRLKHKRLSPTRHHSN